MTLNYNFRASSGRDTHGTPERREAPVRTCSECDQPIYAGGLCKLHYDRDWRRKEREATDRAAAEAQQRRIDRYEARQAAQKAAPASVVFVTAELAEARRRYPLVSDAVALKAHRDNPRKTGEAS